MTTKAKQKAPGPMKPNAVLQIAQTPEETGAQALARVMLEPQVRHGICASAFTGKALGSQIEAPGLMHYIDHLKSATAKAEAGDLGLDSRTLAAQAITLDSMFTDLAGRAALNVGQHLNAAETYVRLALKAQSNCRATLEALAKLHQPREQTVRHVHVNDGGQAIVADHFHHHRGGIENANSVKQSDATGPAGECRALPRPDASGIGVPVSGSVRTEKVSDARGDESGGT